MKYDSKPHLICQRYLSKVYKLVNESVSGPIDTSMDKNLTQGEILCAGINKILSHVAISQDDIFVDLGSGTGRIVLQVFLQSQVKEALGIEFIPELHQQATLAANHVLNDLPELCQGGRRLDFISGSFFEVPFEHATIALISATCFDQRLLFNLGKLINKHPNIHTVISLRPLLTLERLVFKKAFRVQCSWDVAQCYIYRIE